MAALPRTAGLLMGLRWVQRIETTAALVAGARVISSSKRATENSANEEPRVSLEEGLSLTVDYFREQVSQAPEPREHAALDCPEGLA